MRRGVILCVLLVGAGVAGYMGWRWLDRAQVERVLVRGAVYADTSAVTTLAGVVVGDPLARVSTEVAADRVRRHPWIERASVSAQPTGSVIISVREREPVALVMDGDGRPAYYLDRFGFRMPAVATAVYDVPVVRGLIDAYHPVTPVESRPVLELMALLPDLEARKDALLSEIHQTRSGDIELRTAVSPAGQSIRVRLGQDRFEEKLDLLQAYWMQAVLAHPEKRYEWLDLRFRNQVVAHERSNT
ncbi:MAG: FtsQ-type POTRA domain-containing protein [Rhodothermales bacterium]|nr:FtsQ-type POTRA domain-containing protein [Rhodothermales bacterium]MBO6778882.1 FtsQ-type POTRA domain-containing protein [Rhodothermales bacterium]